MEKGSVALSEGDGVSGVVADQAVGGGLSSDIWLSLLAGSA